MMRFRYIFFVPLVFDLLRRNYSLRTDYEENVQPMATNFLFRYIASLVSPLIKPMQDYYKVRSKQYMIAACTPTYTQIERVLNYWYNYNNKITIIPSRVYSQPSYLYVQATPPSFLYDSAEPAKYWGKGGNYSEKPIVNVPKELYNNADEYAQFIADLNLLTPFFVPYTIKLI